MTWFLQRVSGLLLVAYLSLHLWLTHAGATRGAVEAESGFEFLALKFKEPFWFWTDVTLLGVVLFHALYGLRAVLLDSVTSPPRRRVVSYGLLFVGIAAFVFGYWGLKAIAGAA